MSKRKNVIRAGDAVKIVTPNVFIRCGYPLSKQIVRDTLVTKEQRDAIAEMLKKFGLNYMGEMSDSNLLLNDDWSLADNTFEKVLDAMVSAKIRMEGFGGKDRTIYTEYKPNLKDVVCTVSRKKIVKTGIYHHSGGSYDAWGDYDFDPAYLQNEKTHVILHVYWVSDLVSCGNEIWIEKCWVEKFEYGK